MEFSKKVKVDQTSHIQLDDKSSIEYYSKFISNVMADTLLDKLLSDIPWREVTRAGQDGEYIIPRLQCWMSDSGVEAGLTQKEPALEWSEAILVLKASIEDELKSLNVNVKFDYVLMNYYRDGKDHIGFHHDDEFHEQDKSVIASISLGATRTFNMINRQNAKQNKKYDFIATHGSLIVMRGATQFNWLHGVPKNGSVTKPRINLTFRKS